MTNQPAPAATERGDDEAASGKDPLGVPLPSGDVLAALACSSVALNLLALALPLCLLQTYDRIIPNKSGETLAVLMIATLVAIALETAMSMLRSHVTEWAAARFEHSAASRTFARLFRTDPFSIGKERTGTHLERLGAASTVRDMYSGAAILPLFDLPFALLNLMLVGYIGGSLEAIPALILCAFVIHAVIDGRGMKKAVAERHSADERRYDFLMQVFSGIGTIKAMAMEPQMQRRYERLQEACDVGHRDVALRAAGALNSANFYSQATMLAVAAFGALYVIDGNLTTGGLAACSMLAGRTIAPVQRALAAYVRLQASFLARARLADVFSSPIVPEGSLPFPPTSEIVVENVTLRGDDGRAVLDGLNLVVAENECIAISGTDGSGKSLLLSLIQGLALPETGSVSVGGIRIEQLDPISLRRSIAHLPQDGTLFRGTLADNVTGFRSEKLDAALRFAEEIGIDETVSRLPMGWKTPVGNGTHDTLPRGLRQRIAIARRMVDDPKVVLFDESNSGLDAASETALRKWLESLKGRRTLIIISARPSLVAIADRRLRLSEGRLEEIETKKLERGLPA
jgi:ATP-binding cassette subfamily C protein LapB